MMVEKRYLGDGVYVEWNDSFYVLTTENGLYIENRILLEHEVVNALLEYVKHTNETLEAKAREEHDQA